MRGRVGRSADTAHICLLGERAKSMPTAGAFAAVVFPHSPGNVFIVHPINIAAEVTYYLEGPFIFIHCTPTIVFSVTTVANCQGFRFHSLNCNFRGKPVLQNTLTTIRAPMRSVTRAILLGERGGGDGGGNHQSRQKQREKSLFHNNFFFNILSYGMDNSNCIFRSILHVSGYLNCLTGIILDCKYVVAVFVDLNRLINASIRHVEKMEYAIRIDQAKIHTGIFRGIYR